jgi:hypothetical protein
VCSVTNGTYLILSRMSVGLDKFLLIQPTEIRLRNPGSTIRRNLQWACLCRVTYKPEIFRGVVMQHSEDKRCIVLVYCTNIFRDARPYKHKSPSIIFFLAVCVKEFVLTGNSL